jgi:hypothetical protein
MGQVSYRIDFAETFYESLDEELEYVDSYSPDKRKQLIEGLRNKLDAIEAMPFAYPECRELPTPQKQYLPRHTSSDTASFTK